MKISETLRTWSSHTLTLNSLRLIKEITGNTWFVFFYWANEPPKFRNTHKCMKLKWVAGFTSSRISFCSKRRMRPTKIRVMRLTNRHVQEDILIYWSFLFWSAQSITHMVKEVLYTVSRMRYSHKYHINVRYNNCARRILCIDSTIKFLAYQNILSKKVLEYWHRKIPRYEPNKNGLCDQRWWWWWWWWGGSAESDWLGCNNDNRPPLFFHPM